MGLFSSKKKTIVNTSVTRMIEDGDIRSSQQVAILDHVLASSTQVEDGLDAYSLSERLRDAHAYSAPRKFDRFYNYANSGQYPYGLPTAKILQKQSALLDTRFKALMEANHGSPVEVSYVLLDSPNHYHFAWTKLIDAWGYVTASNEIVRLSSWIGSPCYLHDMVVHYCTETADLVEDDDYYYQHGVSALAGYTPSRAANATATHTPFVVDPEATHDFVRVSYEYLKDGKPVIETTDFDLLETIPSGFGESLGEMGGEDATIDTVPDELDYVMGSYTVAEQGVQVRHYFTYLYGSGTFVTLDSVLESSSRAGHFYPRLYARLESTNLGVDALKDTLEYKKSVNAGRKLDVDWRNWVDQIHESIEDTDSITQAYMCLALAANSSDPLINRYMYHYFKGLYDTLDTPRVVPKERKDAINLEQIKYQAKEGTSIRIEDEAHAQTLSFSAIGHSDVIGVIGKVGSFSGGSDKTTIRLAPLRTHEVVFHSYKYQVTETTYREVRIYGLSMAEQVRGGKVSTSSGSSENLIIPMDKAVLLGAFRMSEREALYSKAMHIVFNTLKVVKKKWYQSGVFQVIMFIIAVVITVMTNGAGWQLIAVAKAVAVTVAISIAMSLVTKLAVKLGVNVQVVAIVAVVAMAYGGYLSANNTTGLFNVTAKTMLMATNQALALSASVAQEQLRLIAEKTVEFESGMKAKMDAIKELEESQGLGVNVLNPMTFTDTTQLLAPNLNLYQTPSEYYTRMVHTGNPGVVCYDIMASYVNEALTLPTLMNTIERIEKGT